MLVHHDSRDYAVASSEAAAKFRSRLESQIERGRSRIMAVVEKVQTEVPKDRIITSASMRFMRSGDPQNDRLLLGWNGGDEKPLTIHDHALQQIAERARLPWSFVGELREKGGWGLDLLNHNLREIVSRQDRRLLVREVNGEARGVLTAKFRRLDNRPIVDAFMGACQRLGLVPIEGHALDTKVAITAVLPMVFEPIPNEVMAVGYTLSNSDFGDGALSLRGFLRRLWCTNDATMDEALRQVHLGRELDENFEFSERTYRLDTERSVSMVQDVAGREIAPDRVNQLLDVIRKANEEEVTPGRIKEFLKRHVTKGEAERITEAYNGADVVNLPPGNTSWRFSNAISWIAGQTTDEYKKLDLMKIAALALPNGGAIDRN